MMARDIILVVDDSPGTLGVLNDALEEAGYTVLVATEGMSALALVERITPNAILLDAVMPGLDGFETCRRLKQRPDLTDVPVIFMTGLTETENVVAGLAAGGSDYVTKPVVPDEILARLRVHLATARRARESSSALDSSGRHLLSVGVDGTIRWCTPKAAARLFGPGMKGTQLPPVARSWLASLDRTDGTTAVPTLVIEGATGPLMLSLIGPTGPNELVLRLTDQTATSQADTLRRRLGLTAREAEVLMWLSRGKQNRDIADILGMSPRTANKHLEQIYAKLGVENRTSAVGLALRALNDESAFG